MDYILFGILLYFFAKGLFKGFVSMLFSMLGIFFIAVVSWQICPLILGKVQEFAYGGLEGFVRKMIDEQLAGEFSDMNSFVQAISQSRLSVFGVLLFKLLGDLSFDGNLTAGQILAPSITNLVLKVLTFVAVFVVLFSLLRLAQMFLTKLIKKCGLSVGNRLLGGVVGVVKGLLVFGVLYFVLSLLSNILMSEWLLAFVQSGRISAFLYDNLIVKFVNLFY